jgi:hypothetical protein
LGNRKRSEKLRLPQWFQLKKYDNARRLLTPRAWFKQIALRIDLANLKRIHDESISQSPCEPVCEMEEKVLDDIRFLIHDDPIVDIPAVISQCGGVAGFSLDTLAMLGSNSGCVRPMTVEDLYMTEISLDPFIRDWSRRFYENLQQYALGPLPLSELSREPLLADSYLDSLRFGLRFSRFRNPALTSEEAQQKNSLSIPRRVGIESL